MSGAALPLVSIVTPAYNAAKYLEELIRSVEAQDYPNIEYLVIDDGSTDGGATRAVLERHPSVRWWSRENRGQYPTLNEGFRAAKGEFVTTISADDRYVDARAISTLANVLVAHPEVDVAHGTTIHMDADGVPWAAQPYNRYPYWMLTYNLGFISHCSMLVRRERLLADGLLFNDALRFAGDGDWIARIYLAGYRFAFVDRPIAAYRHHELQATVTAVADRATVEFRRQERAALDRKYGTSEAVRWFTHAYVTFHRRRVKAVAALRAGGLGAFLRAVREWARRGRGG